MPLLSTGEIIDRTWSLYRDKFAELMSVSSWLLVIAIVDVVAITLYPTTATIVNRVDLSLGETGGVILTAVNGWLIAPIVGVFVLASIVRVLSMHFGSVRMDATRAIKEAWRFFFPLILVSILVLAVLIGAVAIGFIPTILINTATAPFANNSLAIFSRILVVIGLAVSIVLSIRWSVLFTLAPYALLLENKHGKSALTRSRELILGRFWAVLGRIAIPKLIFLLVGILIMGVLSYLIGIVISGVGTFNSDLMIRLQTLSGSVFPIVVAALINPLIILADVIVYRSLKETSV